MSFKEKSQRSFWRIRKTVTITALIPCERSVAIAAPATPSPSPTIRSQVENNIDDAADHQTVQRTSGISQRAQQSGSGIVNKHEENAGKIDAQVEDGVTHQFFRRIHQSKKRRGSSDADQCHDDAADDGEGIDRMNTVVHLFAVPGSEELGDDDGSTGSQPVKKLTSRLMTIPEEPGDRGKCIFPDKASHNDGVDRVVKLLKKRTQ